ncbi:MAG: hypothetical protein V7K25_20625 [Nostoc sp.]|uniref:hypothetical protein n=1 Tax=Nostoc sp. TaxID=1180 RepID=UPI002FF6B74A
MTIATASVDQNTIRRRGTGLRAYDPDKVFKGYTLFTPLTGKGEVYLLNLEGEVVHQWNLPYSPGLYAYLLPNGNLFYNGKTLDIPAHFPLWAAFKGGVVLEADPKGNIIWEYKHPDHHHDGRRLRNGNTILLAIEKIPQSLIPRIKGGVAGTEADGDIYADVLALPEEFTRLRQWKKALKQRDSVVAFVFDVAAGIANSKEFYIEKYARFATPVAA